MTSVECEKCGKNLEGKKAIDLAKVILKHGESGECTRTRKRNNDTIACRLEDIV